MRLKIPKKELQNAHYVYKKTIEKIRNAIGVLQDLIKILRFQQSSRTSFR